MFNQTAHLQSNLLAQAFFSNTLTPINYDNNTQVSTSSEMSAFSPSPSEDSGISSYSNHSPNEIMLLGEFINQEPTLIILEEPVEKFRFRYKSEMIGTHGSLLARSSEKNRMKIYPTVELKNFSGSALIRCSLWSAQREEHARTPHTHRLIMKDENDDKDDPHYMYVNPQQGYRAIFQGMGIIHTAKKYITDELMKKKKRLLLETKHQGYNLTSREESQIRLQAESDAKKMNLNSVTLRFEAFQKDPAGLLISICEPVYSEAINNMKSALTGELKICRIDRHIGSCLGGDEIFILVEKVGKKNIKIKFFELDDEDNEIWSDYGRFSELDVHHQYAIVFKTPPYKNTDIEHNVEVYIKLERPTDGDSSEHVTFCYKPTDKIIRNRKRPRIEYSDEEVAPISLISPSDDSRSMLNSGDLDKITANPAPLNSAEFQHFWNTLGIQTQGNLSPFETQETPMETTTLDGDENNFESIVSDINLNRTLPRSKEISLDQDQVVKSSEKFKFDEQKFKKILDIDTLTEDSLSTRDSQKKGSNSTESSPVAQMEELSPKTKNSIKLIPIEKLTKVFPKLKLLDASFNKGKIDATKIIKTNTPEKNIKQLCADEVLVRRAGLRLQQIMSEKPPKPVFDKLIKQVFSLNNDDRDNALHLAVIYQMNDSLKQMLAVFTKNNFEELINCKNNKQQTPLHVAIEENNITAMKLLLGAGADPNASNGLSQTPLHLLCSGQFDNKKCSALKALIATAGDKLQLNAKSEKGWTGFHEAVFRNNIEAVDILIKAGVDINEPELTHGSTPLALAVKEKHSDIIKMLLQQPSLDVDACDREGNTPLHEASVSHSTEIVKLLLSHGANRFKKNWRNTNEEENDEDEHELFCEKKPIELVEVKVENEDYYESSPERIGENSIQLAQGNKELMNLLLNVENEEKKKNTDSVRRSKSNKKIFHLLDEESLDKLSLILNKSKRWIDLANLMDYSYLIESIKGMSTPGKILLRHAELEGQHSVNDLRQFLDLLEEQECVSIIDGMLEKRHANIKT